MARPLCSQRRLRVQHDNTVSSTLHQHTAPPSVRRVRNHNDRLVARGWFGWRSKGCEDIEDVLRGNISAAIQL
eukprot:CAMPEP_0198578248 /NCGR_PEP_ID=MMETSP1462-20131121/119988_1 /TAXON_ID=1333877 /ORGANISM="Brandtodinium nutriculum, Strain RCC3387" /LENGTH=72 /DNA_ID=CAMNT_0044309541 /DNA_START=75 /DNA_END=290 /DNA_ORIENTATION=-